MKRRGILVTAIVAGAGLAVTTFSAVTYDLEHPLIRQSTIPHVGVQSASGQNTLCLPYNQATGLTDASDLWDAINAAAGADPAPPTTAVVSISRFLRASDSLLSYTGTGGPANNFDLLAGEGYRIQVNAKIDDNATNDNDFVWPITGSEDPAFAVGLLAAATGVSATGMNDYCPPYNRIAANAADLMDEINHYDCPGGTCPFGECSAAGTPCEIDADCPSSETCDALTTRDCLGGANDGVACNRAFMTVSKFIRADDTLLTYSGVENVPANAFELTSGESYRIQMASDLDYAARVFSVDVIVESNPPAPCGNVGSDGGFLYLGNSEGDTRVTWDGGVATGAQRNLVFYPNFGPTACPTAASAVNCVNACPGPDKPDGCSGAIDCTNCGCEIHDGLMGWCEGSPYTRCDDDNPCPTGQTCALIGHLEPNTFATDACDQVQCNNAMETPPVGCGSAYPDWEAGVNCCDQHFVSDGPTVPDECDDVTETRCTELEHEEQVEFRLEKVSLDGESTWFDPISRGVANVLPFKHRKYCEFLCRGGQNHCNSCGGGCPGGTCKSVVNGSCSLNEDKDCRFAKDCLDTDDGVCIGFCE